MAELQDKIASLADPDELIALRDSLDLSKEGELSPIRELYHLLSAEWVFVGLVRELRSTYEAVLLLEIHDCARLRLEQTEDPTLWLEYQLLRGMADLRNGRREDASARLEEFERITRRFGVPADTEYASQMRRQIADGDVDGARHTLAARMATFFPRHFAEVSDALDTKILMIRRRRAIRRCAKGPRREASKPPCCAVRIVRSRAECRRSLVRRRASCRRRGNREARCFRPKRFGTASRPIVPGPKEPPHRTTVSMLTCSLTRCSIESNDNR